MKGRIVCGVPSGILHYMNSGTFELPRAFLINPIGIASPHTKYAVAANILASAESPASNCQEMRASIQAVVPEGSKNNPMLDENSAIICITWLFSMIF